MTAVISEAPSRVITVTGREDGLPAVFEDPSLPHQIVLGIGTGRHNSNTITVSCICTGPPRHRLVIEARTGTFPAAEALAAYRQWHAARGIEVGT